MNWYDPDNVEYNRFVNLDGVEDKILYYLISEKYREYSLEHMKEIGITWL